MAVTVVPQPRYRQGRTRPAQPSEFWEGQDGLGRVPDSLPKFSASAPRLPDSLPTTLAVVSSTTRGVGVWAFFSKIP